MRIVRSLVLMLIGIPPLLAQYPATKPGPLPAKKTEAPKKQEATKKQEEPAKIEGMEIARGDKGFLGIQVVNGNFKLSFYDAKKKPAPPDVTRAVLRWDPKYKVGKERAILTPGGGANSLTSEKNIKPPYNFKLFITLLRDGAADGAEEPAGENHVVDFRQ